MSRADVEIDVEGEKGAREGGGEVDELGDGEDGAAGPARNPLMGVRDSGGSGMSSGTTALKGSSGCRQRGSSCLRTS